MKSIHQTAGRRAATIVSAILLFSLTSVARADDRIQVAAASSLSDVLPRLATAWKQAGCSEITFTFDASSRLASQITAGAPEDLFFSADTEWMDFLQQKDRIETSTRKDLVSNSMVVIVPANSKLMPTSLEDLQKKEFDRIGLAGENVPAGRYARAALQSAGVWETLKDRVVNGSNVRQTLELAARGEVPAAIVYRTDVAADPRVRLAFVIPAGLHPRIVYPVALIRGAVHRDDARRFLTFCFSAPARKILTDAGFTSPDAR